MVKMARTVLALFAVYFMVNSADHQLYAMEDRSTEKETIYKLDVLIGSAFIPEKDLSAWKAAKEVDRKPLPTVIIKIDGKTVYEKKLEYHGSPLLRETYGGFQMEIRGKNNIEMSVSIKGGKVQKKINLDLTKGLFIDIIGTKGSITIQQKNNRPVPD